MDTSQDTLYHYHEFYSEILQAEYERQQRQLARIDELALEIEAEQRMDAAYETHGQVENSEATRLRQYATAGELT